MIEIVLKNVKKYIILFTRVIYKCLEVEIYKENSTMCRRRDCKKVKEPPVCL
jgi:hypothetical protein